MEINKDRRFTTRSSAHGSNYMPNRTPEVFNMTFEEAETDVDFWRIFADTVGGDAIIAEKTEDGIKLIGVELRYYRLKKKLPAFNDIDDSIL
jgi:hypothetical protein